MKHIKTYCLFESDENIKFPDVWYHGTNEDFDEFTLDNIGANWDQSTLGVYFTQHMDPPPYGSTAGEYARNAKVVHGGDAIVYECKLTFENPLIIDSEGWYSSNTAIDKQRGDIKRWLKEDKYDAVIAYNSGEDEFKHMDFIAVVLDPKNIEIIKKHIV